MINLIILANDNTQLVIEFSNHISQMGLNLWIKVVRDSSMHNIKLLV